MIPDVTWPTRLAARAVEAAAAGGQAALPDGALVAVADFLLRAADAGAAHAVADRRNAQAEAETAARLFALVVALVLPGFDDEVAADVGVDALAAGLGALEGGVAAALDGERFAGGDAGVVVGGLRAAGPALRPS